MLRQVMKLELSLADLVESLRCRRRRWPKTAAEKILVRKNSDLYVHS